MNVTDALESVRERFPFPGYLNSAGKIESITTAAEVCERYLSPAARILDFACGPADVTAVLSAMGFQCVGYDDLQDHWHKIGDNAAKILAFAASFEVDFRRAGGNPLRETFAPESFDMVMAHNVLEHLHNSPRDLMIELMSLLKPGGLLFTLVPNAVNLRKRVSVLFGRTNLPDYDLYYWYPEQWRGHVREYTKDDLRKFARNLSVDILELRSCHQMIERLPQRVRGPYRAVTALVPGWRDSWLLVAKKPLAWAPGSLSPEQLEKVLGKPTTYQYE